MRGASVENKSEWETKWETKRAAPSGALFVDSFGLSVRSRAKANDARRDCAFKTTAPPA